MQSVIPVSPTSLFHSHLCLLEEEHDGVDRVIPHSDTGKEDAVKVKLEDGHRDVHEELVRRESVRENSTGLNLHFCRG